MKKNYLAFVAALAAVASCQVQPIEAPGNVSGKELVPMNLVALQEEVSKTYLEFPNAIWEDSDQIAVYDGDTFNSFSITENSGATATFSGMVGADATAFVAAYPASAATAFTSSTATLTLPSEQKLGANNVAQGALLAVSQAAKGSDFAFKNVCGLLGVEVSYEDVTSVKVEGPGLSGTVEVNASTGEVVSVKETGTGVTLTPSGDVFTPGKYYIAVLPVRGLEAGSFKVSMRRSNNAEAVHTSVEAVSIARKGGLDFGKLDTKLSWALHITNKEELFAWNADYKNWTANDIVYIDNDIDMEMDAWSPRAFAGKLFGQGCKLYNLNVNVTGNAAFLTPLNAPGEVHDLIFGSSDGENYDGKSTIVHDNNDGTGYIYVAPIGDAKNGALVSGVTSFCKVVAGEGAMTKVVVGGVVGGTQGAKVENCVNYGEVINESGSIQATTMFVGGVVGNSYGNPAEITGCTNYGHVQSSNPVTYAMGGVLGRGSAATVVEDCNNYGKVESTAVSDASHKGNFYMGGILGIDVKANMTIRNCTNGKMPPEYEGTVINKGLRLNEMFLGGILGFSYQSGTIVENCINECDVINEGQGTYIYLAGIVGQNTGTSRITSCVNRGNVSNKGGTTVASAWAIRLGGVAGCQATAASLVKECENYGQVTNSGLTGNLTGNKEYAIGGISGHVAAGGSIESCSNYADMVWTNSMEGCGNGGIVGYLAAAASKVTSCHNYGKLTFKTSDDSIVKGTSYFGGIVGWINPGVVTDCHNHADITSDLVQSNRVGGIAGIINTAGSVIENCSNEGNLTVNFTEGSTVQPCCVGGIAGVHDGNNAVTVKKSVNSGNVSLTCNVNTTNTKAVGAGGIIGVSSNGTLTLEGNTNSGAVSMRNVANSSTGQYAGGIAGRLFCTANLSGNSNTGNVSASCDAETESLAAGGIAGAADKAAVTVNGDSSKAEITCTYAPMVGALVGYNLGTFSDCKAGGSINGTALSTDNISTLAQGSASTGTVSGTVLL